MRGNCVVLRPSRGLPSRGLPSSFDNLVSLSFNTIHPIINIHVKIHLLPSALLAGRSAQHTGRVYSRFEEEWKPCYQAQVFMKDVDNCGVLRPPLHNLVLLQHQQVINHYGTIVYFVVCNTPQLHHNQCIVHHRIHHLRETRLILPQSLSFRVSPDAPVSQCEQLSLPT